MKKITTAVPKSLLRLGGHPRQPASSPATNTTTIGHVGNLSRSGAVQGPVALRTTPPVVAAQKLPSKTDVDGWGEWRRRCAEEVESLRDQMREAADVVSSSMGGGRDQGQGGRRFG